MILRIAAAMLLCTVLSAADGDRYLLPAAVGTGDGSSWKDAAAAGDLSLAWAALKPGATLHLGSGTYPAKTVTIAAGGEPGLPRTLQGHDTGAGLPVIVGTWSRDKPAEGNDLFVIAKGVSNCAIRDLVIRAVRTVVQVPEGDIHDWEWTGLQIAGVRSGFYLAGGGEVGRPDSGSSRLRIAKCQIVGYTKRGVRTIGGVHHLVIEDVLADSGGKDWSGEPFPMGFQAQGGYRSDKEDPAAPDHDITFIRCDARNNWHDKGEGYWNADGFCSESGNWNLRYIDCRASGNTDGGWDDKSRSPVLIDCVASDNKRNFRLWGKDGAAVLIGCEATKAFLRGGNGDACGVWTHGDVILSHCRLVGNPIGVSMADATGKVLLDDCVIEPPAGGVPWPAAYDTRITRHAAPTK